MPQNARRADVPRARRQAAKISYQAKAKTAETWRERSMRHVALVHRALSGAASNDTASAIGFAAAVRALKHGAAGELLVTRRFAERQPLAAANTLLLAAIFGVRTTTLTGPAELQLDLMAGGVATLARCSNG